MHAVGTRGGWLALGIFLFVVIVVGSVIGVATAPGTWYAALHKPPLNPPNWVFAPVWLALYVCIAVAGWRMWMREPNGPAFRLWTGQLVLNWLWSPVFFTLHEPWLAFAVITLIWGLIVAFIRVAGRRDRVAAWLFVPYLAWVSFAAWLNLGVVVLN